MAFEGLSEKLNAVFKSLKGKGRLTEADVRAEAAMQEIEDKTGLIRRFMQMQPRIAAIEEAAQKIKTLNYRQFENPRLEALATEIMENTAGLKE